MSELEKLLKAIEEKAVKAAALAASDKEEDLALAENLLAEIEPMQKRATTMQAAQAAQAGAEKAVKAYQAAAAEPAVNGSGGFEVPGDALTGGEPQHAKAPYPLGQQLVDVAAYYSGKIDTAGRERVVHAHQAAQKAISIDGKAISGMSESVPADGGFLLRPEYSNDLMQKTYNTGEILRRCSRNTMSANTSSVVVNRIKENSRADGYRYGGVRVYWAAEGDTVTASDVKLERVTFTPHKLMALCYATDELVTDAVAIESVINTAFPLEMSFVIEEAVFKGTGSGQPRGIYPSGAIGNVTIEVAKETGQAADTIVTENAHRMWSRMYARARAGAVWLINQDCEPELFNMTLDVGTGGVPTYLPPGGLSESPYARLLGREVIPVEYASTIGDLGDITLANLGEYQLWDKGGMQSAVSLHVRFLYDEMTYRWTYRVCGEPKWDTALTPNQGTNTLSPFVGLAERA